METDSRLDSCDPVTVDIDQAHFVSLYYFAIFSPLLNYLAALKAPHLKIAKINVDGQLFQSIPFAINYPNVVTAFERRPRFAIVERGCAFKVGGITN